jgi:endonuclease/exonuclease/phosphatase (EEP) superfamily protein YafD
VVLVEVLTAFAPLYALVALAAALWQARRGRALRAAAFALLLVPDASSALRGALTMPVAERPLGRVYVANLAERPAAVGRALADLDDLDADLVWLTEVPETLPTAQADAMRALEAEYPYGLVWPATDGRTLHFLSRFPLRAREVFEPERAPGRPALRLSLDVRGAPLTVYALHTHPPLAHWSLAARNETLAWVAAGLRATGRDALVLGDLNTSAYAPGFARLVRHGGLDCVSPWVCAVGSWPRWLGPLDTGSDHYPVIAEIGYRPLE